MNGWEFFSHLIWPVLIVAVLLVFRRPLVELIKRVSHVRIAGQDLFVSNAFNTIELLLESSGLAGGRPEKLPRAIEDRIMAVAARNPQAGLVQLDAEMERSLRALTGAGNWLKTLEATSGSLWAKLYAVRDMGSWNSETLEWMLLYSQIVGAMEKNPDNFSAGECLKAVRLGLKILGQINAVEREHFVVVATDLPIYTGPDLKTLVEGKRAVAVYVTHDGTSQPRYHAYWTTTPQSFRIGSEVSYEWRSLGEGVSGSTTIPGVEGPVDCVVGWDFAGQDMAHLLSGYDPPPIPPLLMARFSEPKELPPSDPPK